LNTQQYQVSVAHAEMTSGVLNENLCRRSVTWHSIATLVGTQMPDGAKSINSGGACDNSATASGKLLL